ncbi:MAG: protein-L-isoaspartate(D-aspartate) O-methyltransferase [Candidatus Njordarchaeota archaeon]
MEIDHNLKKKLEKDKNRLAEIFLRSKLVDKKYIDAFLRVPREFFVLERYVKYAYVDTPLPILKDATISAISMCLLMCQHAELDYGKTVLEIGTGSGYNAALCAEVVTNGVIQEMKQKPVCSIEIDPALYNFGRENLKKLNYLRVVDVRLGDGTQGWPEDRRFDAIIVTAAGRVIPEPLKKQLKIGGVLVMPVDLGRYDWQILLKIRRISEDSYTKTELEPVRFVPLKGRYGIKQVP